MREIKFRAKNINNKWIYFALIYNGVWGCPNTTVNLLTIGQYTGLKDKNKKEIYEGDIIICKPTVPILRVVEFSNGEYWLRAEKDYSYPLSVVRTSHPESAIIGNIYENPELLK